MNRSDVISLLDGPGFLLRLELNKTVEHRHVSYALDHRNYDQLHLLYRNDVLSNSYLSDQQVDEWAKLNNGSKVDFQGESKEWQVGSTGPKSDIVLLPIFYLLQINTSSNSELSQVGLGMTKEQITDLMGEPDHEMQRVVAYEHSRFIGVVVHNFYFLENRLVKVQDGLLQSEPWEK
ncbi:hypothetical protein GCM10007392_03200 [Saccharospirillum salsuginis]|uniref:Uncharacterized protein n=2 Tax=Saccharospirillum salsuginis TaxID=418750 RepID=A0A918N6K3_9GAMM|nr:hypothetical protein GCM10007392_03200 [Saccharospirillum salsuginis]